MDALMGAAQFAQYTVAFLAFGAWLYGVILSLVLLVHLYMGVRRHGG